MIFVIATTLGGGDGGGNGSSNGGAGRQRTQGGQTRTRPTPKSYVVENGDTLTSIARATGVSVAEILRLNPGVDPQILISGERLKLK